MDIPSANPIPQQPASRVEQNQPASRVVQNQPASGVMQRRPAPITIPAESDYASLDDRVFQKVKELHVQVENQLKSLPVNEASITDSVDAIVALDCPLPAKFTKVDVSELLKKNKNIKGDESLAILVSALGLLEKYGRNLLKPKRPELWKCINFANSVFRMRVDIVKGARKILKLMGYSEVVEDGLSFPSDVDSADPHLVAVVTADLAIAKREIEMYYLGQHPHAYRVKDCLDGTMAMIELPGDSPSGHPKSFFVRRPGEGKANIYENVPNTQFTTSVSTDTPNNLNNNQQNQWNVTPASVGIKTTPYAISGNTLSKIEGIVSKIGDPTPARQLPPDVGLGYFAQNPECVVMVQDTPASTAQKPSAVTSSVVVSQAVTSAPQPDQMEEQTPECVLCGKTTANMQCPTCSGLRCESCDKTWHLHPSRRTHQRQVIKPVPIFPPVIHCSVCGTEPATVLCGNCSTSYCSTHDELCHQHHQRMGHIRKPLVIESLDPATKPVPKHIVLSPVSMPPAQQEPPQTSDSSPAAASKRRPVPAPRSFIKQIPNMGELTQNTASPGGLSKPNMDEFTTDTKKSGADLKVTSKPTTRTMSETGLSNNSTEPSPSPEPFQSLPVGNKDIMVQVEDVVKRDIAILQKIRGLRSTMAIKGSHADSKLKAEESHLLEEHSRLLKFQQKLEESLKDESVGGITMKTAQEKTVMDYSTAEATLDKSQIKYPPKTVNDAELYMSPDQKSQVVPVTVHSSHAPPSPTKPAVTSKPQPIQTSPRQGFTATVSQSGTITSPPAPVTHNLEFSPYRPVTTGNTAPVIQPGRVQQLTNSLRLNSPATAPIGINNNATQSGAWLCQSCGNHNTTPTCLTCRAPMPQSMPARSSVATLGQQIGGSIRMPGAQGGMMRPALTPQLKAQVPQPVVGAQDVEKPAPAAAAAAISPPPLQNIFLLQQIDEIVLEKRRAKEEDERKQAKEREELAKKQASTIPIPPPRIVKQRKSLTSAQPSSLPTQPSPNQGNMILQDALINRQRPVSPGLSHVMFAEEKKRLDEQKAQSIDFIKLLREAEDCGYLPEEVIAATESMRDIGGEKVNEVKWLQENWKDYISTVMAMATNHLQKEAGRSMEVVMGEEALWALRKHYGNVEKAVEECVGEVQRRVLSLVDLGFPHQSVYESLSVYEGKMDVALAKLHKEAAKSFVDRIWLPEDIATQEQMIVVLGQEQQREVVDRRIRLLLAEYELPSWGRAVTAARLIDINKYGTNDAIIAARECGDFERATQYLEKTCLICYAEYPMNKLSTLMNCQCTICMECLHDHFQVIIRDRNILNATCPACDQPDLRSGGHEFTADYFGFLDLLLKGILDDETYQLFQDKMLNWNVMREDNFRWCAHCGNGFINEAPNRRKMRCPECQRLTCFQCKKPWMDQHENITCEAFQAWKEANDPNSQLQGLAIHLKENGIDCPNCKMRYELAKGGCMHFKCVQCTHEFCSGCNSPFKKDCRKFTGCQGKGLHAHHPRDCLFYMRDLEIDTLKKQLQKRKITFNRDNSANQQPLCSVKEQKEGPEGLLDANCGRDAVHAGLCELHYKEYLVSQINHNHIDPADEFDIEQLRIILQRDDIAVPARAANEAEDAYRNRLLQEVKTHLPLEEKKQPRDRGQAS